MHPDHLFQLLGKNEDDCSVAAFQKSLSGVPRVDRDSHAVYYTYAAAGIELTFLSGLGLASVFLVSRAESGDESISAYRGALPSGLSFEMSRSQVHELLGEPHDHGDAKISFGLQVFPWDSYSVDMNVLRISYALDLLGINQVIISLPADSRKKMT